MILNQDITGIITSFQTIEDDFFLVNNPERYVIRYEAKRDDTNETLKKFKNLTYLNCVRNKNFTDTGLQYLPNLTYLDCGNIENFTDAGLKYLPNLTTLNCGRNNNFTDAGLKYIQSYFELCKYC